jgi:ATP-dependent DNA helicase RecQ
MIDRKRHFFLQIHRQILDQGLNELSTYGLLRDRSRTEVYDLIAHLEGEACLLENEELGLELTEKAGDVLFRGRQVTMLIRREAETAAEPEEKQKRAVKLSGEDADLYEVLKELRGTLAKENGVPPFVVFSNATLADMAKKKPVTTGAFKKVSGVGEIKAAWYAKPFVARIREFIRERQ